MADLEIQLDQPPPSDLPPRWRLWQRALPPATARVYLALRQLDGAVLDSTRLAQSLGLSERQLSAAMRQLEKYGFISLPPPKKRRRQDPPA